MKKLYSVSGQLVEVQRYINVPMRWCEQYPARERRELWLSTTGGHDIKLVVHTRQMPARRGHQVTVLLLGERPVGLYNASTGRQANFIRADPPLLWRRCDAALVAGLLVASVVAFTLTAWPALLISLPFTLLYPPLVVTVRFVQRCRVRAQIDRALEIVKGSEAAQSVLHRVK